MKAEIKWDLLPNSPYHQIQVPSVVLIPDTQEELDELRRIKACRYPGVAVSPMTMLEVPDFPGRGESWGVRSVTFQLWHWWDYVPQWLLRWRLRRNAQIVCRPHEFWAIKPLKLEGQSATTQSQS